MDNIKIRGIKVVYPSIAVSVDDLIENYKNKGQDITIEIKEFFGRNRLLLSEKGSENTLTMSIKAAKEVLEECELEGKDIDMIILSSMMPEYLSPPTSTIIHKAIGGKDCAVCYDINVNCVGMAVCFDNVAKMMKGDKNLKKVLLIGSDAISSHIKDSEAAIKSSLGDSACAVILERTEEDCGIIETRHYINSEMGYSESRFPACGTSEIYDRSVEDRKLLFGVPDGQISLVADYIKNMMCENNLKVEDISNFCFSQFSYYYVRYLRSMLSIPEEKSIYLADEIGYTGTTSPFIVLNHIIKEGKVKRGDYIFLWTVAIGKQHIFSLIKY